VINVIRRTDLGTRSPAIRTPRKSYYA
jgi:hypothetical protein